MLQKLNKPGASLEIMIVVAIIALLAAIAAPDSSVPETLASYLSPERSSHDRFSGRSIRVETNRPPALRSPRQTGELHEKGSVLYNTGRSLGNTYGDQTVDTLPKRTGEYLANPLGHRLGVLVAIRSQLNLTIHSPVIVASAGWQGMSR